MVRLVSACCWILIWAISAQAQGFLVPIDKSLPPLELADDQVRITLEDQVAVTRVEQVFHNSTDRPVEAIYVFPVPKGAAVGAFTMWVNGKETKGELVEADKARQVYTDIVRRTMDPGLLEYMGNDLLRLRIFPVPPRSDQKIALSFASLASRDGNVVEFEFPLPSSQFQKLRTLEKFSLEAKVKSANAIQSVYSPSHAIAVSRPNDKEAVVQFEKNQALLDRNFQLFYSVGDKNVGLTALNHRKESTQSGYTLLLIAPRIGPYEETVPRDVILVLDTSGSMRGVKMDQARKALKYFLEHLGSKDRFGLIQFATTANLYGSGLVENHVEQVDQARKWIDNLEANGGTAIDEALKMALELRSGDASRSFTMVFFTDGQPTVGENNPEKILKNVQEKNSTNTRIFPFGVGDDVNATLLDQLAGQTRGVATYVRPSEDIESKVSNLVSKISYPVLTELKVRTGPGVSLVEMYPPQLPDLFYGGQIVAAARFQGQGNTSLTVSGKAGKELKEYTFDVTFPSQTKEDKSFVEDLWARRKVGYLLDQVRAYGEKKELVEEIVTLAKKYGIATPYTSYLIVPDGPPTPPIYHLGGSEPSRPVPPGLSATGQNRSVAAFAKDAKKGSFELSESRGRFADDQFRRLAEKGEGPKPYQEAAGLKETLDKAREALKRKDRNEVQSGKMGVDLSVQSNNLRNQNQVGVSALKRAAGRNCLEIGGVWIDEAFDAKMISVTVKAQSPAYFRLLEKYPSLKKVFQLGNHLVWVTPQGTALIVDTTEGKEMLADNEIDDLFIARK